MTEPTSNGERLASVEALQRAIGTQHEKMFASLDELKMNSAFATSALKRVEEKLTEGHELFVAHDARIDALEVANVKFDTAKNVLLFVAAGFGALVTFVATMLLNFFHKG